MAMMAMMKTRMKIGQHGSLSSFVDINWLSLMIYADNQDTDIGLSKVSDKAFFILKIVSINEKQRYFYEIVIKTSSESVAALPLNSSFLQMICHEIKCTHSFHPFLL